MMALPGHSPPHFAAAGSSPRVSNGQAEHQFPPPMFGHPRLMLPPSPQQFPRYHPAHTQMPMPGPLYEMKAPAPPMHHAPPPPPPPPPPQPLNPHKRPGSSMSISSMLGGEPDRPQHEMPPLHNHLHHRPGSIAGPGISAGAMMSPPHQPARVGPVEYPYKRSQTPDRLDHNFAGSRQRSASSGTQMQPSRPIFELQDRYPKLSTPQFQNPPQFPPPPTSREEQEERARRTSLSNLLHRPNSQPQSSVPPPQPSRVFDALPPQRHNWYADPPPPSHEPLRPHGLLGAYDTKPPGFRDTPRTMPTTQPSQPVPPPSLSPEIRRASATNGIFGRGLAGLLNGPTSQPAEQNHATSHTMLRQDSAQSQSSLHGDRNGRFRHFSPAFGGSFGSQQLNGPHDDQNRKGSDEIPHKAILGLGIENRRGRYSPVPQAVQGAQAPTPVPDGGIKGEQGKIFSGIGGGLGTPSTPIPATSSPLKKDDNAPKPSENAHKSSRIASHTGKRSRKTHDEQSRADGEQPESKKMSSSKASKRMKTQNSYKADLEEMATPSLQRRGTPVTATNRSNANTTNGAGLTNTNPKYDTAPIFKPKKTVKVGTVMSQTIRKVRRHLGTFPYEPEVLVLDDSSCDSVDSNVCMKPKLLPSFSGTEDINCTYTIHVSKTWLQDRERKIICSTRNLWGTGVYTDDSDPIAAAMHMGFVKPAFSSNIDENLLSKIVTDQNPKVDIPKEFKPPGQPLDVSKGKDLKITCVVMPVLEAYPETARFGLRSRAWPEGRGNTPHDGVSFSILRVEIMDIGPEERRSGRTGVSKRARLRVQMEQRIRATQLEKERVEKVMKRLKEKADLHKKEKQEEERRKRFGSVKAPSPLSNEVTMEDVEEAPRSTPAVTKAPMSITDGDDWVRQLATAAA